jgi:pullulanase/glycogen debranching enzyme
MKVGAWDGSKNCEIGVVVDHAFSWSAFSTPAIQDLVIYEMHVGDFTEDTSSGVAERGKYSGVTEKLTYLTNLGINCIELMPISHFQGGASYFSWGYMTRLFFAPSTRYKGAGDEVFDLKTLVEEAHKVGIAVVLDMVYNHAENDPNYLWRIDSEYYFNPWGLNAGGVGDNNFNCTRAMTVRLIADNMKYFLEQFKIDGFRLDLTGGNANAPSGETAIDHGTLQTIAGQLKAINPNVILIAKTGGLLTNTLSSCQSGRVDLKENPRGAQTATTTMSPSMSGVTGTAVVHQADRVSHLHLQP